MKVYRLCRQEEIEKIFNDKGFQNVGQECIQDKTINSHLYKENQKYLHFFPKFDDLLYLNTTEGNYICTYDIPDDILRARKGIGKYVDFVSFMHLIDVEEYAVETSALDLNHLLCVFKIEKFIDYEDLWIDRTLKGYISPIYVKSPKKPLTEDLEK